MTQVVGGAPGFASGTTGGGDAKPISLEDIHQLVGLLEDPNPQVIHLCKEYNFKGSEGEGKEVGCKPPGNTCRDKGQSLKRAGHCEGGEEPVDVTFDKAGEKGLRVASDKTILCIGNQGVLPGKGLTTLGRNVIVQNIKIHDPHLIWGGDAIQFFGDGDSANDLVWVDHVSFANVGRQFVVTGFAGSGRLTLSYNDFDGRTAHSATCNGKHYWNASFYGKDTKATMLGNVLRDTSGRAPVVGYGSDDDNVLLHAVSNVWMNNAGHDFDVRLGIYCPLFYSSYVSSH